VAKAEVGHDALKLFEGTRLVAVVVLVSTVIMLGASTMVHQPALSAINVAAIAPRADYSANMTLHGGSNATQALCYSSQCQVVPFSPYYGVARVVLDLSTLPGSTFTIDVNSTLGPAYIEQLQVVFYNGNYNTLPAVTSYWKFNTGLGDTGVSNSGVACSSQPTLYAALVASCDSTLKLNDPLNNPAIPIGPGSHTAPSATISLSISGASSGTSGEGISAYPITITALVVAPVGANVAISIPT